jgi:formamidopyrimidine-DNA glycosylase
MFRVGRVRGVRQTQAALREARRELNKVKRDTLADVVARRVVPTANMMAPSPAKGTMVGRATTRGAYLTTTARGQRRRMVGYLNFGGQIRTALRPKRAQALSWEGPGGRVYTMRVRTPRRFGGKHWMERAARLHRGSVRIALARELPRAIQAHIDRSGPPR